MRIYIGSDHAGFEMKKNLMAFLVEQNFEVYDCGPKQYDHDDDYPDYVSIVAASVSKDRESMGIVLGWSGTGEDIVANRFSNVRCALFYGGNKHILTLARQHNDCNMLSLASHFITTQESHEAALLWLKTPFSGEPRHMRRIKKIEQYD